MPKDQSLYVYYYLLQVQVVCVMVPGLFGTSSSKHITDVGSDVILSLARRFEVESDAEISRISSDVREAKGPLGIHQNSLSVKKGGRILTKSAYTEKRGGKQRSIAGT